MQARPTPANGFLPPLDLPEQCSRGLRDADNGNARDDTLLRIQSATWRLRVEGLDVFDAAELVGLSPGGTS